MDVGTFLLLAGFFYGIGVFWYDLLPAKLAEKPWRVAGYPFMGIVLAEALLPADYLGFAFATLNVVPLVFGSLLGVVVDTMVTSYRHPAAIPALRRRPAPLGFRAGAALEWGMDPRPRGPR